MMVLISITVRGQETRIFTNKDGKTIEAELISVNGALVEIRRVQDGRRFELKIVNLSLEDQVWIAKWMRYSSGEWMKLRVNLPNPTDFVDVIGLKNSMAAERVGGSEFDLHLPVGAWVELRVVPPGMEGVRHTHLVRFDGATRWDVTSEGGSLLLGRNGDPPKIVGLTVPELSTDGASNAGDALEAFVQSFDPTRFADSLSLDLPSGFDPGDFRGFGRPVAAVTSGSSIKGDTLRELESWNIEALSVELGEGSIEAIENFKALQALSIRSSYFRTVDGVSAPLYEAQEFNLPQLRDLCLVSIPFSSGLSRSLGSSKGLRLLEQTSPSSNTSKPESEAAPPQEWKGIDQFTALESLHVSHDVRISAGEVASLPRLKSLAIGSNNFSRDDEGIAKLAKHKGLFQLAINTSGFDETVLDRWGENGGLKDLRLLISSRVNGFDQMPKLERLFIHEAAQDEKSVSSDAFAALPALKFLFLASPGSDELAALASLPFPQQMEAIVLRGGNSENLSALAPFTGLRRIEIESWDAGPEMLNFASFPALEFLRLSHLPNLREITDLSALPSLRSVRVFSCASLTSFGTPFENTTLRELYLYECDNLTSLSGFSKTIGLTSLSIYKCNAIPEPLKIDRLNPRARISVLSCEQLDDRRPVVSRR